MSDCRDGSASQFFVFLPSFAFFSPLGHARYDIIVAHGQQPQYRHRITSKARSTHYLLYVACTPRVVCTVLLVLMCTYLVRARTFTSKLFCCFRFLFTYEISTDGLSLIYWVLVYNRFCFEYVVPYIGTAFPLIARRCAWHLTCTSRRVGS